MTNAKRNYYIRLNKSLEGLLSTEGAIIAAVQASIGETLEAVNTAAEAASTMNKLQ